MKIVLSGGGTLGPVIPLLAVRKTILKKYPAATFVWVGTKRGPEREVIEKAGGTSRAESRGFPFFVIGAGKWRRYMSLWNIVDLFKLFIAFFQSFWFLIKEKPNLLISAGGFVSVPLHWAALVLGIPTWVHQQDVLVGFANRLMFFGAKKITTALQETAETIRGKKAEWIGNPCRELSIVIPTDPAFAGERRNLANNERDPSTALGMTTLNLARQKFNIPPNSPVIFAMGGGTGSTSINKLLIEALQEWPSDWHIIHLVGKERPKEMAHNAAGIFPNYHVYEFFTTEMKDAYAISDIVIARAGFGTLTELAALSKPAIIMPMYGSHQEDNARYFAERDGVILMPQAMSTGIKLAKMVQDLMNNPQERQMIGAKLHQLLPIARPEKILEIVEGLIL